MYNYWFAGMLNAYSVQTQNVGALSLGKITDEIFQTVMINGNIKMFLNLKYSIFQ